MCLKYLINIFIFINSKVLKKIVNEAKFSFQKIKNH